MPGPPPCRRICAGWCSRARRSAARSTPPASPTRPISARPGPGSWRATSCSRMTGSRFSYFFGPGLQRWRHHRDSAQPQEPRLARPVPRSAGAGLSDHPGLPGFGCSSTMSRTAGSPSRTKASTISASASASASRSGAGNAGGPIAQADYRSAAHHSRRRGRGRAGSAPPGDARSGSARNCGRVRGTSARAG